MLQTSTPHPRAPAETFQVLMARAAEPAVLEDDPYPVMEDNSNQPEAVDEPLEQMPASEGRAETIPEDTIEAVPPRLPVFKMAVGPIDKKVGGQGECTHDQTCQDDGTRVLPKKDLFAGAVSELPPANIAPCHRPLKRRCRRGPTSTPRAAR